MTAARGVLRPLAWCGVCIFLCPRSLAQSVATGRRRRRGIKAWLLSVRENPTRKEAEAEEEEAAPASAACMTCQQQGGTSGISASAAAAAATPAIVHTWEGVCVSRSWRDGPLQGGV